MVLGVTVIGVPVLMPVTGVVKPASVYHFQLAPVPNVPPETLSEEEVPEQTVEGVATAPLAAVEGVFTVTITPAVAVLLPAPSART